MVNNNIDSETFKSGGGIGDEPLRTPYPGVVDLHEVYASEISRSYPRSARKPSLSDYDGEYE